MKLVENVKAWWKLWSVWLFLIIAIAPEAYNGISALGWLDEVPDGFKWTIRTLAGVGIITRLIKQQKLESKQNDSNPPPPKTIP